ncbi:MAG: FAD-binding oxidoreductase [Micropruina sp.]|uniref:FAD-binding oxidoreductase n=1 Tax=Micropruina sp. TaxID=2737536 RepID=UPI0039E6BDD0
MTDTITTDSGPAESLRGLCDGRVFLPGEPGYDAARTPWNVAADQRPAAVAVPSSVDHIVAVVRAAASAGLRVAPQSTGHRATAIAADLAGAVLLRLSDFTGVSIDPDRRVARVVGATLWQQVAEAAAEHGLAAMHGSSPDVAVAGYTVGGGLSWYSRMHGLASDRLLAAELVLADGSVVRTDATEHPELFWALRGGGTCLGVITALEFSLLPLSEVYAGMLLWDGSRAQQVCRAWADWTHELDEHATTALRLLSVPPLPDVPEVIRGRQLVVIDGAVLGEPDRASALLAPLRDLRPELDTFGPTPAAALTRMHMDPEGPTPSVTDHDLLADFDQAAADALVAVAGAASGSTLLAAEIRHLGGALAVESEGRGALRRIPGDYLGFFVGIAATPDLGAQARADAAKVVAALAPWSSGRKFLNFSDDPTDPSSALEPDALARLRQLRAAIDPTGLFVG